MTLEERVQVLEERVAELEGQLKAQPRFEPSDSSGTIYSKNGVGVPNNG